MLKRPHWRLFLRKYWLLLFAFSVGALVGSCFLVRSLREEFIDPLPEVAEITRMHARFTGHDKAIEFEVPAKFWPQILDALQPASVDHDAAKWLFMAELEIEVRGRNNIKLDAYKLSGTPGAFSDNTVPERRVYYRGGDSEQLLRVLKAAQAEADSK